jgi:hypothetical protein
MGVEYELFTDGRQFKSESYNGGLNVNVDIAYAAFVPLTFPSGWPTISKSTTQLRTAVSNKVIFKSGILSKTTSFQDGAEVISEDLKWDKITGRPLMTKVTEKFNDLPTYSYEVAAYTKYENMGAAYINLVFHFVFGNIQKVQGKDNEYEISISNSVANHLYEGDEIILKGKIGVEDDGNSIFGPKGVGIYLGKESGFHRVYSNDELIDDDLSDEQFYFNVPGLFANRLMLGMVARSGHRNQLLTSASQISKMDDVISEPSLNISTTIVNPR